MSTAAASRMQWYRHTVSVGIGKHKQGAQAGSNRCMTAVLHDRRICEKESGAASSARQSTGVQRSNDRALTVSAVGKSSGTGVVTSPVAAHSVPRRRTEMNPTHSME